MSTGLSAEPTPRFSSGVSSVASSTPSATDDPFVDRRVAGGSHIDRERRQFTNSYAELSADAHELATTIDQYKLRHRRRFINYEEMLSIVKSLGYHK